MFLGNFRFDFANWDLNRKLQRCSGGVFWKKKLLWTWPQRPEKSKFRKNSVKIDITSCSNSTFHVTTGLIFSLEISIHRFTVLEVVSSEKLSTLTIASEFWYSVQKVQKRQLVLSYFNSPSKHISSFELMFVHNHKFIFF